MDESKKYGNKEFVIRSVNSEMSSKKLVQMENGDSTLVTSLPSQIK